MRDKTGRFRKTKPRPTTPHPREEGAVVKDWGGRLPVALIYPNSYYLGMSNLGIHTIYGLLNSHPGVVCERVFGERGSKSAPLSIESRRPLLDFAVLAFSVSYELDYFNIVSILKDAGIPLYAADRDERYPLVIAGGPCVTANPAPLSPFFDCLCIGEAEPLIPDILPILLEGIGSRREELLKEISSLPGIYVPLSPTGSPVARRRADNLDDFATTSVVMTPDTELGDLFLIEAERGCPRSCRFCLVNTAFAPMRCRSSDKLIEQARHGRRYRKRIGLVGPAVADHPQLRELLAGLRRMGAELSVSSLRIESLSGEILNELSRGKARTITIAPEAGSPRLRRLLNKNISDENILNAISLAAESDIKQLKFYFMLGLPSETDEDIEDIIKLALSAKNVLDRHHSKTRMAFNLAPFVPKAGTPFQWLPMAPLPTLNRRLSLVKKSLPPKGIKVKAESPAWSHVQGALSRGGAELAGVIAGMDEISLSGWRKAVEKCGLDIGYYVSQIWDTSVKLPWSMIDSGTGIEHLKREMEKALLT